MEAINKQWFEVVIQFTTINEQGEQVQERERYAIDALSFTEAEERAAKMANGYTDLLIKSETQAPYSEILFNETQDMVFYKVTIQLSITNERTGKEKRQNSVLLVQANNITNVLSSIREYMSTSVIDWEIISLTKTKVIGYHINKTD